MGMRRERGFHCVRLSAANAASASCLVWARILRCLFSVRIAHANTIAQISNPGPNVIAIMGMASMTSLSGIRQTITGYHKAEDSGHVKGNTDE